MKTHNHNTAFIIIGLVFAIWTSCKEDTPKGVPIVLASAITNYTAKTDTAEMKRLIEVYNLPGLFLFEQEGKEDIAFDGKNYGWNNQRFY